MAEKDPNGIDQHQVGAKLDAGKPQMSLLLDFGKALTAVAEVATFGANKYSRGGWLRVPSGVNRYTDAMLRHINKEKYEELDPDSELQHAAHTAWNALARLELMLWEKNEQPKSLTEDIYILIRSPCTNYPGSCYYTTVYPKKEAVISGIGCKYLHHDGVLRDSLASSPLFGSQPGSGFWSTADTAVSFAKTMFPDATVRVIG